MGPLPPPAQWRGHLRHERSRHFICKYIYICCILHLPIYNIIKGLTVSQRWCLLGSQAASRLLHPLICWSPVYCLQLQWPDHLLTRLTHERKLCSNSQRGMAVRSRKDSLFPKLVNNWGRQTEQKANSHPESSRQCCCLVFQQNNGLD